MEYDSILFAKYLNGGGGGGSSNNDILVVHVTFTEDEGGLIMTSDKTYGEVMEANINGKLVMLNVGSAFNGTFFEGLYYVGNNQLLDIKISFDLRGEAEPSQDETNLIEEDYFFELTPASQ